MAHQDLSQEAGWKALDVQALASELRQYGAPIHIIQQATEAAGDLEDLAYSLEDLEEGEPLIIDDILREILED